MSNHIHYNGKPNPRGPYHGEGRMPKAPSSYELETRDESTLYTDYSKLYQMPLAKVFHGNNGREGVL